MNTNKKLLAIIIGGLILIALIIYFIFIYDFNKNETPSPGDQPTEQTAPPVTLDVPPPATSQRSPEEQARDQVQQLAMSFAERYGSSSNQAEFSNLVDLEVFMTPAFQARTTAYIAAEQANNEIPTDYKGVTTKAVVANITSLTADSAEVTVKTKRVEKDAQGQENNFNQDLKLTMKKSAETWQVDSAAWQ